MTTANLENGTAARSTGGLSSDAIEAVAFLARSEHRLRVLELLSEGACSRDELSDRTGVTRVTLSRILGDLKDRDWITRQNGERVYTLTGLGKLVYDDFTQLLGTVSIGQEYPDVVQRLPTDWFDFDLRCLAEGRLVADQSADPLAAARIVANAIQDASSFRSLLGTFIALPMYTYEEAVRAGNEADGTVVFDIDLTETMLSDADLRGRWQTIEAATSSVTYYSLDEPVPCSIDLIDGETVFLTIDRERDTGFEIIRCTHPEVVEWASEVIDDAQTAAAPLSHHVDTADN
ncbi:ArsR family transcriptional regulator [Haloarcula sp. CBA1130]|uniref:helix-turn-helix transcriptional regulator n=1 Tax=unclassified Haloarcula TaxID=2624677 RepID=UPI0012439CC1|nr:MULTISPECIES: winged helix-turn-helix domain-containing protein [unclassified Haloarcula]KAA9395847.1 ArsR family transcriptional regulator [Haloarcula sp. CBA1129]KAA9400223.1 ArsR family transcriptional regulator [Haloarcula sp. CBA1130]